MSRNEVLSLLTSPGFIETEETVTGRITDFRDSVIDFLGKTTGWTKQPSAANRLLSNISKEFMNQATNM